MEPPMEPPMELPMEPPTEPPMELPIEHFSWCDTDTDTDADADAGPPRFNNADADAGPPRIRIRQKRGRRKGRNPPDCSALAHTVDVQDEATSPQTSTPIVTPTVKRTRRGKR